MISRSWPIGVALAMVLAASGGARAEGDLVLKGGLIVDGTGAPGRVGDVVIRGDRIVEVGSGGLPAGAKVVDASGMVVAPGFIDLHTHSDSSILKAATRDNRNYQTQGVTTIVTGNCGGGALDTEAYLKAIDRDGAGTNVAHLIPHGAVRESVLGNGDTTPNPEQLDRMKALIDRGMAAGAWGMSTGLIYLPGRYAKTEELVELSKVVARRGGIYASHVRDEGAGLLRSVDEILAIGRGGGLPVHMSHMKASGKGQLGLDDPGRRQDRRGQGRRAGDHGRPVPLRRFEHPARGDGRPALGPPGLGRRLRQDRRRPDRGVKTPQGDPGGPRRPGRRNLGPDRPI